MPIPKFVETAMDKPDDNATGRDMALNISPFIYHHLNLLCDPCCIAPLCFCYVYLHFTAVADALVVVGDLDHAFAINGGDSYRVFYKNRVNDAMSSMYDQLVLLGKCFSRDLCIGIGMEDILEVDPEAPWRGGGAEGYLMLNAKEEHGDANTFVRMAYLAFQEIREHIVPVHEAIDDYDDLVDKDVVLQCFKETEVKIREVAHDFYDCLRKRVEAQDENE